jgi:hypothetical protein
MELKYPNILVMQDFPQQDQTNCESEVCEIQSNAVSDYPGKEKHKKVSNGIRHNITDNQEWQSLCHSKQKIGLTI